MLIEYGGIRPLYKAGHDYQLLLTFGLSLIVTEGIIIVWSPVGMSQLPPPLLRGGVDLGITFYPKYRLFVMVAAALLVLGAWLFLEKTRYGAIMRAGHRGQGDGLPPRHRHPPPLHRGLRAGLRAWPASPAR